MNFINAKFGARELACPTVVNPMHSGSTPPVRMPGPETSLQGIDLCVDRLMGIVNSLGSSMEESFKVFSEILSPPISEPSEKTYGEFEELCSLESRLNAVHREITRHYEALRDLNKRCRL